MAANRPSDAIPWDRSGRTPTNMPSVQIYLILGSARAGRREVLADLLLNGLESAARPVLLARATEDAADAEVERRLATLPALARGTWELVDGRFAAEIPAGTTHLFVLADGRGNPVDQIEAFHAWLPGAGGELARVITVVDCRLGVEEPRVLRWYDACVHFSDVVLLNRREGVPNKWISDFIARYRKQHYPCLIELVKRGEVANPALVLEPQARRISLLFDDLGEPVTAAGASHGEDDDDLEAVGAAGEAADEEEPGVDPYLERLAGSGRRAREIPDIAPLIR